MQLPICIFSTRCRIGLVRTRQLHGIRFPSSEVGMNVQMSYRLRKTSDIEKQVSHFVSKLGKRLQDFRPGLVHLKGLVERNSAREGTCVSLNLRLPTGQMAAQESADHSIA